MEDDRPSHGLDDDMDDKKKRPIKDEPSEILDRLSEQDVAIKLDVQWIIDAVQRYDYVSIPSTTKCKEVAAVMQILSIDEKTITIPSLGNSGYSRGWNVQSFEVVNHQDLPLDPKQLDIFIVDDPVCINLEALLSTLQPVRSSIRIWADQQLSDIEGCISLESPTFAKPLSALSDPSVPILALVDAMDEAGWVGTPKQVRHSALSGLIYDNRKLGTKRAYLQCALGSKTLFDKGQVDFKSQQSAAYYLAVMRDPGNIKPGLAAKDYQAVTKDKSLVLALPSPVAPKRRPLPAITDGMEHDFSNALPIRDCRLDHQYDHQGEASRASSASKSSSSTSSSSSSSSSSPSGAVMEHDMDVGIPDIICGMKVKHEMHKQSGDAGIRLSCPVHGHLCRKFKSLRKNVSKYGPLAAAYALGAWAQNPDSKPYGEHARWEPSHSDIKAFIQSGALGF